ncbi:MAG TPA: glycoside hydrolase family 9 protein [Marinagarivorans sp.]
MSRKQGLILSALISVLAACGGNGGSGPSVGASSSPISSVASSSVASVQPPNSSVSASSTSAGNYNPNNNVVTSDALIKINQIGFMPSAPKVAVVPATVSSGEFYIVDASDNSILYSGDLSAEKVWEPSEETVKLADFSALTTSGNYRLHVPGLNPSNEFSINQNALAAVHDAAVKAYYFNRASTALEETHAGQWARPAGHPDTQVRIHPSAATAQRPAESTISAPKGWYDAGDYGKYIVNAGISTYTLLLALEQQGAFYASRTFNIPESNDSVPDLLNEIMWNLEWMEAMQDLDGGVYHKLTSKNFSGEVMPDRATAARYVVQKTTAATLNFAAVMAVASRVLEAYPNAYPGKADAYRQAAIDAWDWAQANPDELYTQPADVATGQYDDLTVGDEFSWAAAELHILTQQASYLSAFKAQDPAAATPWWGGVSALGLISLAEHGQGLLSNADMTSVENKLTDSADSLLASQQGSAYGVTMNSSLNFNWGSNSAFLNDAIMLIQAHRISDDRRYLDAAAANLDYVLGRNATDFSFVTGYGDKTPMDIHHRQSVADGIAEPVPGFVAGGPHSGQQDDCIYPSTLAAKSYVDDWCSYSTNEVTINWNAPLVYVLSYLLTNY